VTSGRGRPDRLGSAIHMASTTQKRRTAPRTTSDPNRWRNATTRRKPKQSNMAKALGMLPIGKKATPSKSSSRGGTAGKAAMLTAAAGLAFKNRDKISGMLGKRKAADPKV
jgi:hypothetical protein